MSSYRNNQKSFVYYSSKLNENIPYSSKNEPVYYSNKVNEIIPFSTKLEPLNPKTPDFSKRVHSNQSQINFNELSSGGNSPFMRKRQSLPDKLFKMPSEKKKEKLSPSINNGSPRTTKNTKTSFASFEEKVK